MLVPVTRMKAPAPRSLKAVKSLLGCRPGMTMRAAMSKPVANWMIPMAALMAPKIVSRLSRRSRRRRLRTPSAATSATPMTEASISILRSAAVASTGGSPRLYPKA